MKRRDFLTLSGLALGSLLIPASVARAIRESCVLQREPLLVPPRIKPVRGKEKIKESPSDGHFLS
jgi:hypothetical protein